MAAPKRILKELGLDDEGTMEGPEVGPLLRDLKLLKDNFYFARYAELLSQNIRNNYPQQVTWK